MEARRIGFKLDENLSRHLKPEISALGFDVLTAGDEGLLSHADFEIAAAAKSEGRILLTLDLDFANVVEYPPGTHPGIVVFKPRTLGLLAIDRFVCDFLRRYELDELSRCLVIVEPARIRVRRPDIFADPGDWSELKV